MRSSLLKRALVTAEPIAAEFGLPTQVDDRLIGAANLFGGMRFGVGDGALRQPGYPFRPSLSQPYAEVVARVMAAVRDAASGARGHEKVCVSQKLPIWSTCRAVEGRRLWRDPRPAVCPWQPDHLHVLDDQITRVKYREPSRAGRPQVPVPDFAARQTGLRKPGRSYMAGTLPER